MMKKCTKTSAKETLEPICGNLMAKLFSLFPLCAATFLFAIFWSVDLLTQKVFPLELNLASLTSVRNFVAEWKSSIRREGETSDVNFVNFVNFEQVVNNGTVGTKWSQEAGGYLGLQCRPSFRHPTRDGKILKMQLH